MSFKKSLGSALKNIKRSPYPAITSILIMALTFFTLSAFASVLYLSAKVLNQLESRAQITAFFKDDASQDYILAVKKELEETGLTSEVSYTSKEDALKLYTGQHKDEPLLLESVTSDIFPASLDIRAKYIGDLPLLAGTVEKKDKIEEVAYYKDIIGTFQKWSVSAKIGGAVLVGILAIISILTMLNTISNSINARKEELIVMRLVGASNAQLSAPFIFQGMIYGALASLISAALFLTLILVAYPKAQTALVGIPLPQVGLVMSLICVAVELLFGSFLGFIGSFLSVKKYLKV